MTNPNDTGEMLQEPKTGKYLKVETEDKSRLLSLIGEAIEDETGNRIYAQKLSNGNYEIEIIQTGEEPPIS
jgi:hypothetical protein